MFLWLFPVDSEPEGSVFLVAGNDLLPLSKVSEGAHFRKVSFW
jgi:hypothetical protein